jgi:hypothetical protein
MSYVLPPNNAIAAITDLNQPESVRRAIYETDLELQLADYNNTPEGSGPVRGWGGRGHRTGAHRR